MHKLESIQENETNKLLWDFEIQADTLIPARRTDSVIFNKKQKQKTTKKQYKKKPKKTTAES